LVRGVQLSGAQARKELQKQLPSLLGVHPKINKFFSLELPGHFQLANPVRSAEGSEHDDDAQHRETGLPGVAHPDLGAPLFLEGRLPAAIPAGASQPEGGPASEVDFHSGDQEAVPGGRIADGAALPSSGGGRGLERGLLR